MRDGDRVLFHRGSEILFFYRQPGRRRGIGFHPFGGLEQCPRGGSRGLWVSGEKLAVHKHGAAIFVPVRRIGRLVRDVAHLAVGQQQAADRLGVGDGVHVSFVQRQAQFAGRKHEPGDLSARVDPVGAEDAIGEDERRRAHSRHADSLSPQFLYRANSALRGGLDPQTAAMDAAGEFHVQALFDGFEKIHDQVMRDVKSAQRQHVFVIRPLAFDQRHLEAFLLEEAFLDGSEDGSFAGKANVTDPDFSRAAGGVVSAPPAA